MDKTTYFIAVENVDESDVTAISNHLFNYGYDFSGGENPFEVLEKFGFSIQQSDSGEYHRRRGAISRVAIGKTEVSALKAQAELLRHIAMSLADIAELGGGAALYPNEE